MNRIPAVNYLSFDLDDGARAALQDAATPCAMVVTHPDYTIEMALPTGLRRELVSHLA